MRFTWMNPEVIIFEPFTKLLPRRYTIVLRIDIQFTIKKKDCKVKSLLFKFDCTSLAGALSFNFYSSHIAARISLRKKLRTNINVRVHTDFCTRVASPRLHWFSRTNIHNPHWIRSKTQLLQTFYFAVFQSQCKVSHLRNPVKRSAQVLGF